MVRFGWLMRPASLVSFTSRDARHERHYRKPTYMAQTTTSNRFVQLPTSSGCRQWILNTWQGAAGRRDQRKQKSRRQDQSVHSSRDELSVQLLPRSTNLSPELEDHSPRREYDPRPRLRQDHLPS